MSRFTAVMVAALFATGIAGCASGGGLPPSLGGDKYKTVETDEVFQHSDGRREKVLVKRQVPYSCEVHEEDVVYGIKEQRVVDGQTETRSGTEKFTLRRLAPNCFGQQSPAVAGQVVSTVPPAVIQRVNRDMKNVLCNSNQGLGAMSRGYNELMGC